MANESEDVRPVDYIRLFPWLHMARAFRIAVDPRKLLLAGVALLAISGVDALYNQMFVGDPDDEVSLIGDRNEQVFQLSGVRPDTPDVPFGTPSSRGYLLEPHWPWDVGRGPLRLSASGIVEAGFGTLARPWETIRDPVVALLKPLDEIHFGHKSYLVVRLLWALVVWGVVAGAITRMTALEFARDERLGLGQAVRYAAGRIVSYVMAPGIAVVCLALVGVLCFVGGLVGRIPIGGELFAGILWFLPLLAGFVMALVLVGASLGWPLMYATISTQDSDAFDGFSRSYTFVFGRPWYYGLLLVVTVLLASIGVGIVNVFATLTTELAADSVATGMTADKVAALRGLADEGNAGTWAAVFWENAFLLLAGGFGASFHWVAATIAYFLLRRADDGTALDEVELEFDEQPDELAPLAGVAASSQPAAERPIVELSTKDEPAAGDSQPGDGEDESPGG